MNRIKRARGTNSVMTGVFYLIAVFFFALLILAFPTFMLLCVSGFLSGVFSSSFPVVVSAFFCTTVTLQFAVIFPASLTAVITAVPAACAVISPHSLTVATAGFVLVK